MKNLTITTICIFLLSLSFTSAIIVDADYITLYPGEEGSVSVEVDNNENFDIEDVSIAIVLSAVTPTGELISLPFTVIGNSEKDLDDLDEDDDDSVTFKIKASSDITPGDYNIPYVVNYKEDGEDENLKKEGSFGIRVSAKTDLDYVLEIRDNAIIGEEGRISLEIINKGLGEIKSASVQVSPQGYELLSKNKIFVGSIDSDDSDIASFDVIYKNKNAALSVIITYKDFDNKDQTDTVNLPIKVYTSEEALELGLIQQSRTGVYIGVVLILIIVWIIWRRMKKRKKNKKSGGS
ncbi:MAG: hypothetical protein ABIB79_02400 [archaeon]